ncbi:2Fe-2S iron-sulfur cluster-binding protein [Mangrovicoccus ximenensis]|uniref:2Fe-2S iron-sulfur cluster-binding protein n=1 Tax=Mangrovicoccus ximenensis TaxID=1911570 RepID=UPI000D347CEE|nr:2Fe-2S iron-sulfur cluster-binding protein [Mangrovicoccus ximenensis]
MGIVRLIDRQGNRHELQALEGWRVMEILRDWGMFVPPRCGGSGQCGMCHVKVAEDWSGKVLPPGELEAKVLPLLPGRGETSRLSCQILWSETLDGLTVALP